MKVILAKYAGFCFGVKRAVQICEQASGEFDRCVTLGPIIHNDHVIKFLEEKGIKAITDISQLDPSSTVIIRSHGAGKKELQALEKTGVNIIDATCPDVKRIHDIVSKESMEGRLPIIIGDHNHPEVAAISEWCDEFEVFESEDELQAWLETGDNAKKPLSFVFQTTNRKSIYNSVVEKIEKVCTNRNIFDTICDATSKRQKEAEELAKKADVMVVVGDRNSANSLRLKDICKEHCQRVIFVESASELDIADTRESDTVGVTAGASTPAWIIKEVTQKMSDEIMLEDDLATCDEEPAAISDEPINDERLTMNDEPEAINDERLTMNGEAEPINDESVSAVGEAVLEVASEETQVIIEGSDDPTGEWVLDPNADDQESASMTESFEEMLEKSIKTLHTGQKVTGVVTSITATEVSIDLGTKQSGYIPISEFTDDQNTKIEDVVNIGDTIESFVMRVNDVEGMVMLSKKRLDAIKNWDEIEASKDAKATVQGVVTEENRGGVVVNVKGVRVFVPASQTGLPKSAPMSELVRKTVKLRITEVNQSRRRVVGSIRAVQSEERREKTDRLWEEIENGKQYDGVVKSMTSYGVFVDIGGVDGMIHISELSWTRIKQPSDVMSVGDEVSVYVLSFDKDNKKISLGYKKNEDNPWTRFTTQYSVGDIVNVKIVKMMPFGAFAEICPGVDGLIHISQITDHRIGLPSEVLSDGQLTDVKITEINNERKKVSLSIRALLDPSSQPVSDSEAAQAAAIDKTPVILYDTDSPPEEPLAPFDEQPTIEAEAEEAVEVESAGEETTQAEEVPEEVPEKAE